MRHRQPELRRLVRDDQVVQCACFPAPAFAGAFLLSVTAVSKRTRPLLFKVLNNHVTGSLVYFAIARCGLSGEVSWEMEVTQNDVSDNSPNNTAAVRPPAPAASQPRPRPRASFLTRFVRRSVARPARRLRCAASLRLGGRAPFRRGAARARRGARRARLAAAQRAEAARCGTGARAAPRAAGG